MKMAWGKTQEASALHCLLQLFPHSLLEEVGVGRWVGGGGEGGVCGCVGEWMEVWLVGVGRAGALVAAEASSSIARVYPF